MLMFYDVKVEISPDRRLVTVACAEWDKLNFTRTTELMPEWRRRQDTEVLFPVWREMMGHVRARHGGATMRQNDDGSFRIHATDDMPARA